jgi:hypothetical protein
MHPDEETVEPQAVHACQWLCEMLLAVFGLPGRESCRLLLAAPGMLEASHTERLILSARGAISGGIRRAWAFYAATRDHVECVYLQLMVDSVQCRQDISGNRELACVLLFHAVV